MRDACTLTIDTRLLTVEKMKEKTNAPKRRKRSTAPTSIVLCVRLGLSSSVCSDQSTEER